MVNEPLYSIPDTPSDWAARIEAACRVVEEDFGVRLTKAHPYHENRPPIDVLDRLAFLKKKAKSKTKCLSLYTGPGHERTSSGFKNLRYYSVGGISYANKGVYNCTVQFPEISIGQQEAMLVKLGDALRARSAQYTPVETAKRFYLVQWCTGAGTSLVKEELNDLTKEEKLLPLLLRTWYAGLDSPLQPHWLGWLNYWSEEVAHYLGFPDPGRDQDLLCHSYRTPTGAWLVKVCAEPLDATNPKHVKLVVDVYKRFPRLGARPKVTPRMFQRTPSTVYPSGLTQIHVNTGASEDHEQ